MKPLTDYVLRKEQHKAEIFWALKSIMSHFSYSSAEDICDIFRVMFHDSAIAKKMKCGPTKLSYIVAFGIAPYFKQLLLSDLQKAPCFVLSFDESLNHELQKEQMDFVDKYFVEDKVVCCYLTSTFHGHTQAEDLKKMFEEGIKDLEPRRMIQISMDGPSVNWKLHEQITEERNEMEDYPSLIDIGSCSLHVVHGAFRTGVQKTKWSIDGILRALYNLFNDSPAKREDYKTITGSDIFPLEFCGHRWLEDKKVAERAISIWPNIHKYVVETLKKPKSKIPSSASFATVKSAVHDILIVAKLQFFVSVATVMQPFLKMFQADAPMLPFLTSEVVGLLTNLMQRFIKQSELEAANTPSKIARLDVTEAALYVKTADIDIGFAAAATVTKLSTEKKISDLQVLEYRKECGVMFAAIVTKSQERSPLKHYFARNLVSLDPRMIVAKPDTSLKKFKHVLTKLVESKWKTSTEADDILSN